MLAGPAPVDRRLPAGPFGYAVMAMPTYVYRCEADHEFEAVQPIVDRPLSVCAVCEAPVRRVVMPVGIVFKGSGFYKTDSRKAESTPAARPSEPAAKPAESTPTSVGAPAPAPGPTAPTASPAPAGRTGARTRAGSAGSSGGGVATTTPASG